MNNIYLIGMPGCGKSTIGKTISSRMNMNFVDLDEYIVKTVGESIPEMFEKGEKYFRKKEFECLSDVSLLENTVVATGGGVVETLESERIMKTAGTVVFIDTPPENIINNSSLGGRPLLAGNKQKIFDIYKKRYDLYKKFSHIQVTNDAGIEQIISKVMNALKKAKD